MVNKENAKQLIKGLLEKYDKVVVEKKLSKYTEADTKAEFIEPLFEALGWDVRNRDEVTREETISKKRVDYGFRINGIPKFFLEAKALREDLDDPKFAEQAINYAWHKGCTWAVLTDFDQGVKIFNAEWKTTILFHSHFKTIPCKEFLDRFEELWLLSRESFEQGLLDKEAEKVSKKSKKTPVGEQLLNDLTTWRAKLSKDILERNKDKRLTEEELDEAVQRIIDRLIFIRNCEDRELEPPKLLSTVREWGSKHKGTLAECIIDVFSHFRDEYDSELFNDHLCDQLDASNQVLEEIINGLDHTKDRTIKYDFSALDADVLGNVYEQYLGYILKKTAKRAVLKEKYARRKEQGIYYTPTYIVDYIVRNTLGELLKDKKVDVEKIRVLDPACGSGSFLIKALDILNEFHSKTDKDYGQTQLDLEMGLPFTKKVKILQNNIFGVDLDTKAVEIAQLSLLLRIAEKRRRLPLLRQNVKCGNSLIDDKKVAGDKAFKWDQEFKQIMDEGGFDVVIGNPPYVRPENVPKEERDYYLNSQKYDKFFGRFDVYILFIEKALKLLKPKGYFSFIIPNSFLNQNYSKVLREWIIKDFRIMGIVDLSQVKVFEAAEVNTCILVLQKSKPPKNNLVRIIKPSSLLNLNQSKVVSLQQGIFLNTPQFMIRTDLNESKINIIRKISKDTLVVSKIFYVVIGSVPHDTKTGASKDRLISSAKLGDSFKPYLEGKDMSRYRLSWRNIYLNYQPKLMHRPKFPELFENEKLIIRNISTKEGLLGVYDKEHFYTNDTVSLCVPWFRLKNANIKGKHISIEMLENSEKYNLLYCLGLINSKVLNFYFKHILSSTLHVYPEAIRNLHIKITSNSQQQSLIDLVKRMLSLNKRLNEIGDKKTDERQRIEEEIKKTDAEIDELVYKLYGITESEKKIIEESLK